jgi:hypothetical protein
VVSGNVYDFYSVSPEYFGNTLYNKKERRLNVLCRKCLLKHVTERKIEEARRRGRRSKQLYIRLRKREDTGN